MASDITVVGTIFLVQRVAKDRDYVAQVQGTVRVKPRNGEASVELSGHQGVAVNGTLLDPIDVLLTRPQLLPERLAQGDLRSQGLTPSADGGGWGQDPIRDQAPRALSEEQQAEAKDAAALPEADDAAAPPAAAAAPATSSTTTTATATSANQMGVANPGLGGQRGSGSLTINPTSASGAASGGGSAGASPGAAPVPLTAHPGFPSP